MNGVGPETNLFAWVANLLSPNESAADGGAFGGGGAPWGEGGAQGGEQAGAAGNGADEDSDLWSWQRGSGAADAAEEEAAMAAGQRLWDKTRLSRSRAMR
jgi:hypothetical protein